MKINSKSNAMNVILIQIDSLNRHFLSCYGNDWVQAPNIARFAERATIFDQHYTGSLPCMPARREIWTGTEEFWWRGWGPLEPWDTTIAYLARKSGVTSALITDHYHFFEWGSHTFFADFDGYEFIRGHELDNWRTAPIKTIPDWATRMVEVIGDKALPYLRNVHDFVSEEQFFGAKVMNEVATWLDNNHMLEQFFLHVDCFDVHEPFHVPEPYRSMYTDEDYRQFNPWPLYGSTTEGESRLSQQEIDWVRAQFAGKLTMVDKWFGNVLATLEKHNLYDNTCIILTTDHGHYLGEHDWIGKPFAPMYDTLVHIPLLIWHPTYPGNGQRIKGITQTVDLYSTVLELLGVKATPNSHSRSLVPLLRGERDTHRNHAIYGYNNRLLGITDGTWALLRDHDNTLADAAVYTQQVEHMNGIGWWIREDRPTSYPNLKPATIHGVETPVWRKLQAIDHPKREDLLFNKADDIEQSTNIATQYPDEIRRLEQHLHEHMTTLGVPDEQFKRIGIST